jgi:hypothetical protein
MFSSSGSAICGQVISEGQALRLLKKRLAERFPRDIDGYIDGKTTMLLTMLRATGFPPEQFREVERANQK